MNPSIRVKRFLRRVHDALVGAAEHSRATARAATARRRRVSRTHPDDLPFVASVAEWHSELNALHFGGALGAVTFRVSRRMRRRLGHYELGRNGAPSEIAISVLHIRRDGLDAARSTLLHEMVHQWQHENGLPVDHGAAFRRMCCVVGAPVRAPRVSSRARVHALP